MNKNEYISVSQYATIKGITRQAVYKQLNNKLKKFVILVDNKKYIDKGALSEVDNQRLNEVEQHFNQPNDNHSKPFFEKQIEEKDKTIEKLLQQIDSLQEQNGKLTDLLHNSQILLAAEKKLYLEQETTTTKEKKGLFRIFKKKNKETLENEK